ncbi:MAG TPA: M15 family metallopeptidase [Gemmatimonadaceae bacterium]|nr:M15 family metallopeptidase [Gemmatimonadaceae bacterium]
MRWTERIMAARLVGVGRGVAAVAVWAMALACSSAPRATPPTASPAGAPVREADIVGDSVASTMLVDVQHVDSTIRVEARYATPNNFTGAPLPGYEANRALLLREAAEALGRVQRRALAQGYSLKVFDGYRPVRATRAMVEWTERVGRQDLIRDGYIAARSRHNLGLAIDLTLIRNPGGDELAMGTPYDTFSEAAHTANATGEAARNRALLVQLMESEGFTNYDQEWWHFSYPASSALRFDVVIR